MKIIGINSPKPAIATIIGLFIIVLITIWSYKPSLHGGFIFDDHPNIANNSLLEIQNLDPFSLWQAAWSRPGSLATKDGYQWLALELIDISRI